MTTKNYYNQNAKEFTNNTINIDMTQSYKPFEEDLTNTSNILDIGCGPGRDLKYFATKYNATGLEPSESLAEFAKNHSKAEVINNDILSFKTDKKFQGIWACASLLHIKYADLNSVFTKIESLLEDNGILYCSFKYGNFEGHRNDRYFTDLNENRFAEVISRTNLKPIKIWKTNDIRTGREQFEWLNAILRKD